MLMGVSVVSSVLPVHDSLPYCHIAVQHVTSSTQKWLMMTYLPVRTSMLLFVTTPSVLHTVTQKAFSLDDQCFPLAHH